MLGSRPLTTPLPALPRFHSQVSEHLCCRDHAEQQSQGSSRERHPPGRQSEGSGHRYRWGEPLASGRNETQAWEIRPASGSRVINRRLSQGLGASRNGSRSGTEGTPPCTDRDSYLSLGLPSACVRVPLRVQSGGGSGSVTSHSCQGLEDQQLRALLQRYQCSFP